MSIAPFIAIQLDSTIHLGDLILFGSGIIAFFKIWMAMRDDVRDHGKDIKTLKETAADHGKMLSDHDKILAEHNMIFSRIGWPKHFQEPR